MGEFLVKELTRGYTKHMMRKKLVWISLCLFLTLFLGGCNLTSASKEKEIDYRDQGIALMEAEKYEEAAKMFQLALDQSVGFVTDLDVDICYYKAAALFAAGDNDGAIEVYNKIIKYDSDEWEAQYLIGTVYLAQGDEDTALEYFDIAIDKNDDDYELYIQIYEQLADTDADTAQTYLDAALKIGGSNKSAVRNQGYIYYLMGDTDTALSLLQQAAEDSDEKAILYLAQIEIDLGDYETALSWITQGISMDGTYMQQFYYAQIVAYEYLGDYDTAKSLMETYLDSYPNDSTAVRENTYLQTR